MLAVRSHTAAGCEEPPAHLLITGFGGGNYRERRIEVEIDEADWHDSKRSRKGRSDDPRGT